MSNTTPISDLRGAITKALSKDGSPSEAEIVRLVVLGNEVRLHPDYADMAYVEGKHSFYQLDKRGRLTYHIVKMWVDAYNTAEGAFEFYWLADRIERVLLTDKH